MHPRGTRTPLASGAARWATTLIAVIALVAGTAAPALATSAPVVPAAAGAVQALAGGPAKMSLAGFNAGNIISDAVFTDESTMTEAQIQAFFNSKVKTCRGGSDKYGPIICLKDYKTTSVNRPADAYCKGYTGAANETAARIISRVAQSCNINPQVLIVMLQKEQGLVTHTWPSKWRYDKALGQGCPDDAACNPAFVGFFHQIYGAGRYMQMYMEGRWFTYYAPGKTWNILYHPNRGCGTARVAVANKATSALYYYTPYQPNAAALKAGYGTGDGCSSYGNRNFYNYFTDWFGSTQAVPKFAMGAVTLSGSFTAGQVVKATAAVSPSPTALQYQWYRNGTAIAGATGNSYALTSADVGAAVNVQVIAKRSGYTDGVVKSQAVTVEGVVVDRLYGQNREDTAVSVSRAAWPSGTRTVMLATSGDFADALSAAAAAGKASASLLLTRATVLPVAVAAELKRLAPSRVVLVGGQGVISAAVARQVATALPAAKVERMAGINRYETSRIAAEAGGASASVLIATGRDFPDALNAAAVGNRNSIPVLLVDGNASRLDAATVATLKRIRATSVTIVGGDGVVTPGIAAHFAQLGMSVDRIAGVNRYATNAAVLQRYFPTSALKTLVASGEGFADALSASVLAGRWSVPLILSTPQCLAPTGADFLKSRASENVTLVGGPGALSEDVAELHRC